MDRSLSAPSNAQRVAQLLRMPERLFITPLGALSLTLLVPLVILYG
jgi:hypothetical protein